jgi:hypothetical protein
MSDNAARLSSRRAVGQQATANRADYSSRSTHVTLDRLPPGHAMPMLPRLALSTLIPFITMVLTTTPTATQASESHCYSIRSSDLKNQCLAQAKGQASYCYSIQDADTKNSCLAQVKGQRSYCYSIRSNDLKNQCLALVR